MDICTYTYIYVYLCTCKKKLQAMCNKTLLCIFFYSINNITTVFHKIVQLYAYINRKFLGGNTNILFFYFLSYFFLNCRTLVLHFYSLPMHVNENAHSINMYVHFPVDFTLIYLWNCYKVWLHTMIRIDGFWLCYHIKVLKSLIDSLFYFFYVGVSTIYLCYIFEPFFFVIKMLLNSFQSNNMRNKDGKVKYLLALWP